MTSSSVNYGELLDLIAKHQARNGITDQQFAHILGYERVQTFTMTRDGILKLSFTKIPLLASALAIDAASLLRTLLAETMPDVLDMIDLISPGSIQVRT